MTDALVCGTMTLGEARASYEALIELQRLLTCSHAEDDGTAPILEEKADVATVPARAGSQQSLKAEPCTRTQRRADSCSGVDASSGTGKQRS
jgi:hypothetical protein